MRLNRVIRFTEFIVIFIPVTLLYLFALILFIPVSISDGDIPGITLGLVLAAPCLLACYRFFIPAMLHGTQAVKKISVSWKIWIWLGCILSVAALVSVMFNLSSTIRDDDFEHAIRMWSVGRILIIPLAHIFIEAKLTKYA